MAISKEIKVANVGLQQTFTVVAKWLSKKVNLFVNWHNGTEVSADIANDKINIPIASCAVGIDEMAMSMLRSSVYHECGHILYTDPTDIKGVLFKIYNGLEDVRMEALIAKEGDGIRGELLISNTELCRLHGERFSSGDTSTPAWKQAMFALMFDNMYIPLTWTLKDEAKALYDLGKPIFDKVGFTKTSKDCEVLAVEIYNLWKDYIKENPNQKPQKQQSSGGKGQGKGQDQDQSNKSQNNSKSDKEDKEGQGQEQGQGEEGEGEENGQGAGEDQGEADPDNSDGDGNGDGEDSDAEAGKQKPANSKPHDKAKNKKASQALEDGGFDFHSPAKDFVAQHLEAAMTDPNYYTSCTDNDIHFRVPSTEAGLIAYESEKEKIGADIGSLIRNAEEALASLRQNYDITGLEDGDIDFDMLTEISYGLTKNVFQKTIDGVEINTAVSIVIDQSGSMDGKSTKVCQVLIALGELLNRLDIPFEIVGTSTNRPVNPNKAFTRWNGMEFLHYKEFEDNWFGCRASVMSFRGKRNNIDGEALEYAYAKLQTRNETRKIIFSICDGIPESGQGMTEDKIFRHQLKLSCDRIRETGTEVYAIAINTPNPITYYGEQNSIMVNTHEGDESLFSQSVIGTIANTVIKGRFSF